MSYIRPHAQGGAERRRTQNDILELRGVTLLIAVIFASVFLSVALSLLDITYKQVLLVTSANQSQVAFYNADSVMECALYYDQQKDAFDYNATGYLSSGISCNNQNTGSLFSAPNSSNTSGPIRTTVIHVPCASNPTQDQGVITIAKNSSAATTIYATGYSSCITSDPRKIERGITISY